MSSVWSYARTKAEFAMTNDPTCPVCERPIRDLSQAAIAGEVPPDEYDREDAGSVTYRHANCDP